MTDLSFPVATGPVPGLATRHDPGEVDLVGPVPSQEVTPAPADAVYAPSVTFPRQIGGRGSNNTMANDNLCGKMLDRVTEQNDVGVLVQYGLKVNLQYTEAVKKANRML